MVGAQFIYWMSGWIAVVYMVSQLTNDISRITIVISKL